MTQQPAHQAPRRTVKREPLLASAPAEEWGAWLRYLVRTAKARLAGVSLVLVGALALGGGALWLFGELAGQVGQGEPTALDLSVRAWLQRSASPTLDELARFVSLFGSEVVALLLVVLLGLLSRQRRWGAALSLVVVTGGAQLLDDVLKDHFRRTRPSSVLGLIPAQAWSFPSGHAMVAAAFYLFLAYLGWRLLTGWGRIVWPSLLVGLVLLVGLARLYLGVHYLTDVVAGYAAGAAWTEAVVLAGRLLAARRRR